MKSKLFSLVCSMLLLCTMLLPLTSHADTVHDAQSVMDGIVGYQLAGTGASDVQGWIDGDLTANAGVTAEWYILALSQQGTAYDFSHYEDQLLSYLNATNVTSASSRQKYALVLAAVGSGDAYIAETLHDSIGQQGIMSWVYSLHLLNNGYTSEQYSTEDIVSTLLSLQLPDGGWALSGSVSDTDVTAMTLQALAPHAAMHADAVERALTRLSELQREGGDYASYGVLNPESTAQVITALSALGIDCMTDERFIKNGNTLFDGIEKYRLPDGSFCHTEGGASNHTATVQTYYALTAYLRQQTGRGSLYLLDHCDPAGLSGSEPAPAEPPAVQTDVQTVLPETQSPAETAAETSTSETEITASASETAQTSVSGTAAATINTGSCTTASATETDAETETVAQTGIVSVQTDSSGSYKLPACLIIAGIGGAVCIVMFVLKKRNWKNFLVVLAVTAVGIVFICVTDFRSTQEYYGTVSSPEDAAGTVTMTIRCDTVAGKQAHVPADGVILEETEFPVSEGDTVFDVLTLAAQAHNIQMEYSGTPEMAYISGIGYLYEFDFGDLSGWVYHVNGASPDVGCGEFTLQDGDVIEWLYTCDLGNDVIS